MKKRILSILLAVITVMQVFPVFALPIIAEDSSVVGSIVRFKTSGMMYAYKNVTTAKAESGDRVYASNYPETLMILDVVTVTASGYTYYKLGTVDGSAHAALDVRPWFNAGDLEIVAPPTADPVPEITYNGQPAKEIPLFEDGKMPITATKPAELEADVRWAWEILAGDEWVRIGDKTSATCDVSYALVVNLLDENGQAKLRAVACDGDKEYPSEPVTVTIKRAPKPLDQSPSVVSAEDEPAAVYAAPMRARSGGMMRSTSTEQITITVNFIRVRADGTQEQAAYPDIRTLKSDYEAYTVTLPSVLSYYPSLEPPSNPYGGVSTNPKENTSLTTYLVDAEYTSDQIINIYYYPKEVTYTVYHYFQNIRNDQYENDKPTLVEKNHKGIVGTAVPDTIHKSDEVGFQHLYYERPEIAADGSTIVEIYYDREYFTVLFDLVHKGAYGQENLYVKYGTLVKLNDPICKGWKFGGWKEVDENGNIVADSAYADFLPQPTIESSVTFQAQWTGEESSYTVIYWFENADDGHYTIRHTETINHTEEKPVLSGRYATWNGVIPSEVSSYDDYEYFTFDAAKTKAENRTLISPDNYQEGVLIEGDGTTTVNVFFARRYYQITFVGATPKDGCGLAIHTHGDGTCEFNPMYCTHSHSAACQASCSKEEHIHKANCKTCDIVEHIHTPACCGVHTHTKACYNSSLYGDFETTFKSKASEEVRKYVDDRYGDIFLIGSIISAIVNYFVNNEASEYASQYGTAIQQGAPPQNLKSGQVYILKDQKIHIKYDGTLVDIDDKVPMDIPAIYFEDENGKGTWYYYNGAKESGDVEPAICGNDDHDHTGGCDTTKCTNGGSEHIHSDANGCYKCGNVEHEHSAYCGCTHEHTADCYGYLCMLPEHTHANDGNGTEQTIRILQAKYGQDITAYVPYFRELSELNLHMNGDSYFTYWKYDSTGTDTTQATDRYVKHVTMVPQLCYSNGITTRAQYSSNVKPYVLYYLFESFTTGGTTPLAPDGSGRLQYPDGTGKYYDSDPTHLQFIMLDNGTDNGAAALAQLQKEGLKTIEGMLDVKRDDNPQITPNVEINGINFTRHAYFYDRIVPGKVVFHNDGKELLTVPAPNKNNPLLYGVPLAQLVAALKDSADYQFDYLNIPYPESLEVGAYEFDGWYTTPYKSEYTKVDWTTATMPSDDLNLYAHWKPVTRYVHIYEDSSMQKEFATGGYQEVPHGYRATNVDYTQSQYHANGYTFNGWYYYDSQTGEKTRFLLTTFPVTENMNIFAEWKLDQTVSYQVNFVYKDASGVETQIADPLYGTAVAGQNKTFRAATGTALYTDYQEGFFPRIGSHTVQMVYAGVDTDGDGQFDTSKVNEYTFYYDKVEEVNYWVKFIDEETGAELYSTQEYSTRKAAVTELFVPIEGYTVDEYSKSLIISSTEPDKNNIITFYYTKIKEEQPITAPWVVNHWIQNADGTYSVYQQTSHVDIVKPGDDHSDVYYGTVLNDILGYTFASVVIKTRRFNSDTSEVVDFEIKTEEDGLIGIEQNGTKQFGCELTEYGMEINFYYSRNKVGYRVEYKAADTGEVFHSYDIPAEDSVPHGDSVTVTLIQQEHMKIVYNEGYQLVDDTQTSIKMTLYIDESRNVITFLYQKFDATFEYQIVCDDENSGVGLSMTREVIAAGSSDSLIGAIPFESDTYYFAGWFADAACTKPINADTINSEKYSVKLVNEEVYTDYYMPRLTPTKTAFTYEGTSGNLYLSATYYALFLPRSADLTITVNSGNNDTFILTLTGKPGTFAEGTTITVPVVDGQTVKLTDMPIGEYTVTSNADWSWRYEQINTTATVVVKDGGTLTVNLTPKNNQWLTSDSSNIPKATP